ncbi:MAG: FAD-binding protein [Arenibacterium sp.]
MTPSSEAELAELIAGLNTPVRINGGGTRGMAGEDAVLGTSGLSGVALYEPGALTLIAGAGTPVVELDALLATENQRLAFEPMDHRGLLGTTGEPTIGGVVAGNISGPRRIAVGACRDHLLGVRFVDGAGQVVMNGGRVMKNVTGYDLVKLMSGSWGTLGALSQVSLKVLPGVEAEATLSLEVADHAAAVAAMSAALGAPFEVTGAAYDGQVRVRIEGFADSVAYRTGQLREVLGKFGSLGEVLEADASAVLWRDIRDVAAFHGVSGDVWRLSVKPSDAPEVLERVAPEALLLDWGGGLVWLRVAAGSDVRAKVTGISGHATLVRAEDTTRTRLGTFHPEPAPLAKISAGIRAKFDPRGLLNPGLMA